MKKTTANAFITQHCGNRHDKICRRIWENEEGRFVVKVNGEWIPLQHYQRDKHYDVIVG